MSPTPEFAPSYVSVVNEFPEDLYDAMRSFVRSHPNWDQYRLMQVALAGFLFQQGSRERAVSRHYLDGLFDRGGAAPQGPAAAERVPAADPRVLESPARSFTAAPPSPEERLSAGAHQASPARPEAPVVAAAGHGGAQEPVARVTSVGGLSVHGQQPGRPVPGAPVQNHHQGAPHPHHRGR